MVVVAESCTVVTVDDTTGVIVENDADKEVTTSDEEADDGSTEGPLVLVCVGEDKLEPDEPDVADD